MNKILPILFLFVVLIACEPSNLEPAGSPLETIIFVQPSEVLANGERILVFHNTTEKIYNCANFHINAEYVLSERSFKISFAGVDRGGACATELGPATSSIALGEIANGDYYLEINNGGLKNKGLLSVTSREIELVFAQQKGIEISNPKLMRVPEYTYWGIIGIHNEEDKHLVEEFADELKALGAEFNKQNPGNYGHYQIDEEGNVAMPEPAYYSAEALIFSFDKDEEQLKGLVQSFGLKYKEKIQLNLQNYRGLHFSGAEE